MNRIGTHIEGLDERMQGGIPKGSIVLVSGEAGSMKSSVSFNTLYKHAIETGSKVLYLTFEQHSENLMQHMENLGYDMDAISNLMLLDIGQLRDLSEEDGKDLDWMLATLKALEHLSKNFDCEVVAIDSLNALYSMSAMKNPRKDLFMFTEGLRKLGMTTLLITEIQEDGRIGLFGSETYIADGIIHLDLIKEGRNLGLYIGVKKMRSTNHTRTYYPLLVSDGNFSLVTK